MVNIHFSDEEAETQRCSKTQDPIASRCLALILSSLLCLSQSSTSFNRDAVKAGTGRRFLGGLLDHTSYCYTLEVSFYSYIIGGTTAAVPYTEEACILGRFPPPPPQAWASPHLATSIQVWQHLMGRQESDIQLGRGLRLWGENGGWLCWWHLWIVLFAPCPSNGHTPSQLAPRRPSAAPISISPPHPHEGVRLLPSKVCKHMGWRMTIPLVAEEDLGGLDSF